MKIHNLDIFQHLVGEWAKYNFPNDDLSRGLLGLTEEVGESCRALLKREQNIIGTYEEWTEELDKELGDVFIKLLHVICLLRPDASAIEIFNKRWNVIKERDWIKYPETGRPVE